MSQAIDFGEEEGSAWGGQQPGVPKREVTTLALPAKLVRAKPPA